MLVYFYEGLYEDINQNPKTFHSQVRLPPDILYKKITSSARLSQSSERPRTDLNIWIRVFHSSFLVFCVFGLWVWVGVFFFFYFGFFWFSVEGFWSFVSGLRVFCIFFVWIWSVVFDSAMIQILSLYLEFEVVKNMHVLEE